MTLRTRLNRLLQEMALTGDCEWEPRYNIAPTQPVAAVRAGRTVSLLRWGLVPSWAKDKKLAASLINARAETVAEKPAFRTAFKKRRCLVLADGYYEWKAVGKLKQPYLIHRADDAPFAFAGLWEAWHGDGGPPLESCAVITTTANDLTRPVHDRSPVIVAHADWDLWLAPDATPFELQGVLRPFAPEGFVVDAVSTLVNSPRNDRPECVEPAAVA